MFHFKFLLTLALALTVQAASVAGLQKRGNGVLKLDFAVERKEPIIDVNATKSLDKRDPFDYRLTNKGSYYIADVYVGSNQQKVSVDVDTGSSDLWVIDSASGEEASYGSYDHSASSSYEYVAPGFGVAYVDKSNAQGDWVKDDVSLSPNGPTLKGQQFGDATTAKGLTYGIFGIGFQGLEAASQKYDNVPASLKKEGYINKNAYSLYLNSQDATQGSVLFGGIDHDKYSGDLHSLSIAPNDVRTRIPLESLTIGGNELAVNLDVTLDSGSTLSYLSPQLVDQIAEATGARYSWLEDMYFFDDCNDAQDVTVNFNGISITIPKEYVAGKVLTNDGTTLPGCALFFLPQDTPEYYTLGDNFLRNVYAVYDLDDRTISLAPVKYSDSENISPIS